MQKSSLKHTILKALEGISSLCAGQRCALSGLYGSSRAFIISEFFIKTLKPCVVVVPSDDEAEEFYTDLSFFLGSDFVNIYPSPETLPFEMLSPHPDISVGRLNILYKLIKNDIGILVTTPQALMQKTMPIDIFKASIKHIQIDMEIDRDKFIGELTQMGYSRTALVEMMGEISIRGGILDIFTPLYSKPVRMEFFGNEVESIRFFDPDTQRTLTYIDKGQGKQGINEIVLIPFREIIINEETKITANKKIKERANGLELTMNAVDTILERINNNVYFSGIESLMPLFYEKTETIFPYIAKDSTLFIVDEQRVLDEMDRFTKECLEMERKTMGKRQFFVHPSELYLSKEETVSLLAKTAAVNITDITDKDIAIALYSTSNIDIRQAVSFAREEGKLKPLVDMIKGWQGDNWNIFLISPSAGGGERLKELLEGYELNLPIISPPSAFSLHPSAYIVIGSLTTGFRIHDLKLAVITEDEIFGERIKKRQSSTRHIDTFLTQMSDLEIGEPVVHTFHGIGIYQGLKRITIEGIENDFLLIEYLGSDKLYLPVTKLNLVGKYTGVEGKMPPIDKLGGTSWEKTKLRVKKSVEAVAKELLELYAIRKTAKGFAFSKPDRLFIEFEESFEYDETPDQISAIEDVLKDMEDEKPMDRLICGDVGYGKTEVAMRAAFKAAMDNKQVAVLVPTTILAQQHYLTFKKRLSEYPVIIDVISRFKNPKEQKTVLQRLAKGEVDIIIGTHRLLQKDVSFKELGLVVIDEEQWFGVAHKERLKQLRKEIDILTLTATPIPRTLHLSLSGIRDLSIINTPPEDRLAIKTTVTMFDDETIRNAVIREMARHGQVFFVHNRVESIGSMLEYLIKILPEARIQVAHGQMERHKLESVMMGFVNKEFDILLSTAIIESGLDIPSANTIIINRADKFGLAQLYQLRGRVGRSRHRAYAYLLVSPEKVLTRDAEKRLRIIQELSELGSGFKIASHDMEIRGAGELLGHAQSGRIADVGFELYTQMLEETIMEMKGERKGICIDPEINLKIAAFIPDNYIHDMRQRLNIYKRLASCTSKEEIGDLKIELIDRFGKLPDTSQNLISIMELKLMLKTLKAIDMSQRGDKLYITFTKDTKIHPEQILNLLKRYPGEIKITPDKIAMSIDVKKGILEDARWLLQELI
ncbi:MAG: transcription-repair coupling factor [Deltaproteobacteria bacterium]|nr:transcription-repair coupling factor [Deltaproteobacteria bacterium]